MAKDTLSAKQATGQKFIARNRAPRVQIEYDVELYGSERKVEIPFVMGVVADLAGQSEKPLPEFEQRRFLEIDIDNFDERLKAIEPRVAMNVKNDIAGEGHLAVDLRFESIDDFSPASIARQIPALDQLLQARSQLSNLLSYMDGKSRAEELIAQALANPKLLAALTGAPKARGSGMEEKKEEGK
ncbi:type VI secretion system contractile sheath small subunit [Caballeronia sordidicola]|uniref:Uncharacterized protein ImpB n=1 Tax=Caballeronia sordidicola TaxID=196367 RepID=A0A226X666_CABSO|nr:type VI secretion system contractile sheath small subunit [Caballeronia sordidicola]OXC78467.1 Uncharacterized protein ImpB [Caballeronia sordidicola]